METLEAIKAAMERHPSSQQRLEPKFELVDLQLRPTDIYLVIDALYDASPVYTTDDENDVITDDIDIVISVLESTLEQAGLPLTREEYESPSLMPEETGWKQLGIFGTEEQ